MKGLIFAAGLGTRLRPVTDTRPKALVTIHGKTLLEYAVEKFVAAGITQIVINVHHFAGMIMDFVRERNGFGADISFSDESDLLRETGGGIRHAGPLLGDGNFLVHNVDIVSNLDLRAFYDAFPDGALAMLAVSRRETSRYLLFDDDMRLAGWTNTATGEVRSPYPDLDPASCTKYAFAGIHVLAHKALGLFGAEGFGEKFPVMDFYLKVADRYPVCGFVQDDLKIIDVGKPQSLAALEEGPFWKV